MLLMWFLEPVRNTTTTLQCDVAGQMNAFNREGERESRVVCFHLLTSHTAQQREGRKKNTVIVICRGATRSVQCLLFMMLQ
jgi:hypothetical protein